MKRSRGEHDEAILQARAAFSEAREAEAVKATGEYLIGLLGKAVRGEAIRDMAEAIGSFRAAMALATPQPTEREPLRMLVDQDWLNRHIADDGDFDVEAGQLFAQPTERERIVAWNSDVNAAPHACHVLAAYFDDMIGEWICEFVPSPPTPGPWTHWLMVPMPVRRGEHLAGEGQ